MSSCGRSRPRRRAVRRRERVITRLGSEAGHDKRRRGTKACRHPLDDAPTTTAPPPEPPRRRPNRQYDLSCASSPFSSSSPTRRQASSLSKRGARRRPRRVRERRLALKYGARRHAGRSTSRAGTMARDTLSGRNWSCEECKGDRAP
ncbi:uncharacterized protein RHOBADRAFT_54966, partial [Rhodotorula graminis WP1]